MRSGGWTAGRVSQRIGATRSHEVSLHGEIQQLLESQNSEDGEREDKDATGEWYGALASGG